MQTTTNGVIGLIETDLDPADFAQVFHPRSRWSRVNRPSDSVNDRSPLIGDLTTSVRADVTCLKRDLTAQLQEFRRRIAVARRFHPR